MATETMTMGQAIWKLFGIVLRLGLIAYVLWHSFRGDLVRATYGIVILIWIEQE